LSLQLSTMEIPVLLTAFATSYIVFSGYSRNMQSRKIALWTIPGIINLLLIPLIHAFWALPVCVFNLLLIPAFDTQRPLRSGERRVGGTIHLFAKRSLKWGLLAALGMFFQTWMYQVNNPLYTDAEMGPDPVQLATLILTVLYVLGALVSLFFTWIAKLDKVEEGPTGPLAN